MKFKLFLLASAFTVLASTSVNAADAIVTADASPVVMAPSFSWAGAYVGGQVGYGWGKSTFTDPNFSPSLKPDGFLGGIYAGYNFAVSESVILGIDGDITYNNLKDGKSEDFGGIITGADSKLRWSGAVRARAGYAIDRFLPYIAGGVAFGDVKNSAFFDSSGFNFYAAQSKILTGWTIGAGVDYAATDNLILRLEYRYTDYGRKDFSGSNELFSFDTGNKFKTNELRLGLAYKF